MMGLSSASVWVSGRLGVGTFRFPFSDPFQPRRYRRQNWKTVYPDTFFNAATDSYEDLVKAGIIDPTKVVRTALQNAASVAGLMITTEAAIAEKPKKDAGGGHAGHGHGGMPDMGGMM
jgi:hypothetical protein